MLLLLAIKQHIKALFPPLPIRNDRLLHLLSKPHWKKKYLLCKDEPYLLRQPMESSLRLRWAINPLCDKGRDSASRTPTTFPRRIKGHIWRLWSQVVTVMKNSCAFTRGPALSCEWALQQWLSQSYYELQYAVMQFGDMKNKRGIFFFSILFFSFL